MQNDERLAENAQSPQQRAQPPQTACIGIKPSQSFG
jgi:hypothetical protein